MLLLLSLSRRTGFAKLPRPGSGLIEHKWELPDDAASWSFAVWGGYVPVFATISLQWRSL